MPDKRRKVSREELHEILVRELGLTAAGLCGACRVPKPVFLESRGGGPNWRVPALEECSALCHTILQDVVAELSRKYDLSRPRAAA